MTQPADFPPGLLDYFEESARRREAAIDERLAELTPRERSLIRDAAVMGHVLGSLYREGEPYPKDTTVMRAVVYAALREPANQYAVLRGLAQQYIEPEGQP